MPCQVGPVPFRKVNYLAPVGLPNIGGRVQLFIYAHSGKCLLFLLHFCDFIFFKVLFAVVMAPLARFTSQKKIRRSSLPSLLVNMGKCNPLPHTPQKKVTLFYLCNSSLQKRDWLFPPKSASFPDHAPITSHAYKCRLQSLQTTKRLYRFSLWYFSLIRQSEKQLNPETQSTKYLAKYIWVNGFLNWRWNKSLTNATQQELFCLFL